MRSAEAIRKLEYLTRGEEFQIVSRGNPRPDQLPPDKRLEVGLDPQTWQLEVVADPDSDAQIENPLTHERGTALDWAGLMKLAETHAVRFMKVMTCTNVGQPLGMGLWEGVPMRDVIWMARPVTNVRRVYYYGYHNNDLTQRFQSSLPIGRVLEDPPGEHPVILCYKLNDQWLTPESGAPVRVVVPDAYGNKSVKWLQRIVLTNSFRSSDTYAEWNNDTESHTKTYARFIHVPSPVPAGQPIPITGVAQVGMSGLTHVQVWLQREGSEPPGNDPYFGTAPWQDAQDSAAAGEMGGRIARWQAAARASPVRWHDAPAADLAFTRHARSLGDLADRRTSRKTRAALSHDRQPGHCTADATTVSQGRSEPDSIAAPHGRGVMGRVDWNSPGRGIYPGSDLPCFESSRTSIKIVGGFGDCRGFLRDARCPALQESRLMLSHTNSAC